MDRSSFAECEWDKGRASFAPASCDPCVPRPSFISSPVCFLVLEQPLSAQGSLISTTTTTTNYSILSVSLQRVIISNNGHSRLLRHLHQALCRRSFRCNSSIAPHPGLLGHFQGCQRREREAGFRLKQWHTDALYQLINKDFYHTQAGMLSSNASRLAQLTQV